MKEVDYYREQCKNLRDEIDFYQREWKKQHGLAETLQAEIAHLKSEEYQMEIALPYTRVIERKQIRINELQNATSARYACFKNKNNFLKQKFSAISLV